MQFPGTLDINWVPHLSQVLDKAVDLIFKEGGFDQSAHLLDVEALEDTITLATRIEILDNVVLQYVYGRSKVRTLTPRKKISLCSRSAYLLFGCLGGLGRSLLPWMFDRGCRNFAFLSRSGADKPKASAVVEQLQRSGASVHIFRVDASDGDAVKAAVSSIQATMPIWGVVHAAMVLQDGMFEGMSLEKYSASISPKTKGALSLHNALAEVPLDFFVLTSSQSAVLGSPGQANYCAGNSYLDSLAWYRRRHGLAGSSLALPMVIDVGVVAENTGMEDSLVRKGVYGISEDEMIQAFEVAMLQGLPVPAEYAKLGDAQILLGLEPTSLAASLAQTDLLNAYWVNDARLSHIRAAVDVLAVSQEDQKREGFLSTLAGLSAKKAISNVAEYIMAQCSKILMLAPDKMDVRGRSIASYGLDSMIGVELRTWLYRELGLDIGFQALIGSNMDFESLAKIVVDSMVA